MKPTGMVVAGAVMACLLAIVAAPPVANAAAPATLNVPPVCLVDATGDKTTVTKEACGITVPAGITLYPALPMDLTTDTHRISWNGYTDAGLYMSETQTIVVMDLTPPDLTLPTVPPTIEATGPETTVNPEDYDAVATDHRERGPGGTKYKPDVAAKAEKISGNAYRITWTATDKAGLVATATRTVNIVDTTPPTIECHDVLIKSSVPVPLSAADLKAEFTDIADGTKTLSPPAGTPDPLPRGAKTTVTYSASDSASNAAAPCKQDVRVLSPLVLETLPSAAGVAGSTYGEALAIGKKTLFVGNPGHAYTTTVSGTTTTLANSGIVKAYKLTPGSGQYEERTIKPTKPAENLNFGSALAVISVGDSEVLAVGAPGKSVTMPNPDGPDKVYPNVGEVHLYNPATGALIDTISNPNTLGKDHFGAALASMGDKLVVAAHMYEEPEAGGEAKKANSGRVYVFDSAGSKLYDVPNPGPATESRFGYQVEATDDGTTERIYVSANLDDDGTDGKPAVYAFGVTEKDDGTTELDQYLKGVRPSGTGFTGFGAKQIRPAHGGGVYVGESGTGSSSMGKIHHYVDSSTRHEFTPKSCCARSFGSAFDVDDRLLYAGTHMLRAPSPLHAFSLEDRAHADEFPIPAPPTGYRTERFALEVESSGDRVVVTESLRNLVLGITPATKTRVHVLDLRALDPDITYPAPASPAPVGGSQAQSSAQSSAPQPAQATAAPRVPTLLSTELLGAGQIRLTYDGTIDPFEVDRDDYVMSDASLEVVAVKASGSTVTITYAGETAGATVGTATVTPGVRLVGGIGYY